MRITISKADEDDFFKQGEPRYALAADDHQPKHQHENFLYDHEK